MSRTSGVLAAMKAVPGGARHTPAPQSGGWGALNSVAANAMYGNPNSQSGYGPFLPRPSRTFTDGAFGPMSPIQPVPVDEPAVPGGFPDPRWWQYRVGWNLPTPPRTEGLALASFDQLKTIAEKYSVVRRCIELRKEEICGLDWEIKLTTKAAKAYQGDHKAMRDFGERAAEATKFFKRPDPDYWNFSSWLKACLEEIFVWDALPLIFRPKYGKGLGRGLLGSDLDSIRLVSGATIRPLLGMHGEIPRPPAPAYQQYLYGVPRSDYQTVIAGTDIDDYGLTGAEVNQFRADTMLYVRMVPRRETPYGFCYDDQTEILTAAGWKHFADLDGSEYVATRSSDGRFEWQRPEAYIAQPYDGPMLHFRSQVFDLMVTPEHRMLTYQRKLPDDIPGFRPARFFAEKHGRCKNWRIPTTSEWKGEAPEVVVVPAATPAQGRHHLARELRIPVDAWARFIGWFVSEGFVLNAPHLRNVVGIAQSRELHRPQIREVLQAMGVTFREGKKGFEFNHGPLAQWLRATCYTCTEHRAWNKRIPAVVKNYPPELLREMFSAMMAGDGHVEKTGLRRYLTTSKILADDTVEILQKMGAQGWYDVMAADHDARIGDRKIGKRRPQYRVTERPGDGSAVPVPQETHYSGMIHCVSVPNGTVYVRRNGRTAWCGNSPVEQALLPIISGLQKQEFQLDYFTEGTVPACYISPGDPNMTPTQVKELQDALNGIAGDPAYHLKVIVLPPGSKVEPQRSVDLSDSFDYLVMNQVCMEMDVDPTEVGIIPNVGGNSTGPSASGIRFAAQAGRDVKSRKSTKPLLLTLCDIVNYALQDICGQQDMEFSFEGLRDDEDKAAIVSLGVEKVQNGIASIDEVREDLDLPPWGLTETSEPVVFTAQGPIPFSMAPQLIAAMTGGGAQGTNSGQRTTSSRSRTSQPSVRRGGQTKPNGSHEKPLAPHRESATPGHSAAAGAIQGPSGRTGGTTSRSPVAGSRKRGEGHTDTSKAVESELGALARHLRKGRMISTWVAKHIPERALGMIAEDLAKGVLIDTAVERAGDILGKTNDGPEAQGAGSGHLAHQDTGVLLADLELHGDSPRIVKAAHWPGWERDLGLVGAYKNLIGQAFHDAESRGSELRKKAATGGMFVSQGTLRDLISDEVRDVFSDVLTPLWTEAWHLGYAAAKSLVTGQPANFAAKDGLEHLQGFIGTEGEHWLSQVARTGLGNNAARSELIARTEVARAINSAAIQCYRDNGVTHKHLLVSPGACEMCEDVAEDGDVPLDAPFSSGGVIASIHPACRCCPAPSSVSAEPPLADLGKSAATEDKSRAAFLILRAKHPGDGKWRYLLQKRPGGDWGLPGGSTHAGEHPHDAAVRESTEEIGHLPLLGAPAAMMQDQDDDKTIWVYLHEVPFFQPALDSASTPEETAGAGWFKRKEVGALPLHPPFREQWEKTDWRNVGKSLQRTVNENGEVSALTEAAQPLQAVGSRWPYPHRADGSEWPDAGPGSYPGASPGDEPPNHINDMAEPEPHDTLEPRGGDDGKMPSRGRKPSPPASRFPGQGNEDEDMWPYPQATLQPPAASIGPGAE